MVDLAARWWRGPRWVWVALLVCVPSTRGYMMIGCVEVKWRDVPWKVAVGPGAAAWEARVDRTRLHIQGGLNVEECRRAVEACGAWESGVLLTCGRATAFAVCDDAEALDRVLDATRRDLARRLATLAYEAPKLQLAPPPPPGTAAVESGASSTDQEAAAAGGGEAAVEEAPRHTDAQEGVVAVTEAQRVALVARRARKADRVARQWGSGLEAAICAFESAATTRLGLECEAHAIRVGSGLDSEIIGDHAIARQLRAAADGARGRNHSAVARLLGAALAAGRATRDGRRGHMDLARFERLRKLRPSHDDWSVDVLGEAERIAAREHDRLRARRRAARAAPRIVALRQAALRRTDPIPPAARPRARALVKRLLHKPTLRLRAFQHDANVKAIVDSTLRQVDAALLETFP